MNQPDIKSDILLYTNGRSAIDVLSAADIPGQKLEWLEVLHDGPVPVTATHNELYRIRARHFAQLGWISSEEALHGFERRDQPLSYSEQYSRMELWFEHDLYDQLQLIQLLDRIAEHPKWKGKTNLYQFDTFIGNLRPDEIEARRPAPISIEDKHLELARTMWQAFRSGVPDELERIVERDTSALPYLGSAWLRLCEEFPSATNGLGRTESDILSVLAGGTATPADLFRHCQSREEAPFMGDSSFYALIKRLGSGPAPLLEARSGEPFGTPAGAGTSGAFRAQRIRITDTGKRVLEGEADWLALWPGSYWIGGFEIRGPDSPRRRTRGRIL